MQEVSRGKAGLHVRTGVYQEIMMMELLLNIDL